MSVKLGSVISELLNDAPVAEVSSVVKDLKLIVGRNISSELESALRTYNVANCVVVQAEGKSVVLSEYNADDDDAFVDFAQGLLVKVDHLNMKAASVESMETSEECVSLYEELSGYLEEKYPSEYALLVAPDAQHFVIVGEKASPANYWNARWCSKYELEGSTLTGTVDIDVHYYEDGNVRLKTTESVSAEVSGSVSKTIAQLEDKLQLSLQKTIVDINTTQFKHLRRPLPVTRSKVQWGKAIGNYRLGKDVSN